MDDTQHRMSGDKDPFERGRRPTQQHVFEAAFRKTRTPMVLSDPKLPDCPIVEVNAAFAELTGYPTEAVLGRNCRFLQGPDTDRESVERVRLAVQEQRPIAEEIYNYRRDGTGFWNALYISPIFAADGSLDYFFASQIDVSEHREVVHRQSQRIESIGALASGVAHEFNNLMTVILGSVEQATARVSDAIQRRHLERAGWGAQRAGRLASELLSLSRRQAGDDRVVDLNRVLRDVGDTLAQIVVPSVQLHLEILPDALPVRLDPEQLELVLLNLVRNAVDALPDGGRIGICTRRLAATESTLLFGGRDAVELSVDDDGEGMLPEVAERATELFFTTKDTAKGTGLGLFLALDFVDKVGGRLLIDSHPGTGTRVRLIFPHCRSDRRQPRGLLRSSG
ncbi:PAS domain-containing protein [Lichenicoccus sp.]|uniref:PAS domain-containing protein n=1 Tax=Lichenicoccus sp. TaxID=2781899 RepID=UPI003D0FADE7